MREITLDLSGMTDIAEIQRYLKDLFGFPEYYGGNLDALYDCLTDISEDTTVIIPNAEASGGCVPVDYTFRVIRVFEDAAKQNRFLTLQLR